MSARYLLDTDALSEPIRPRPERRFMMKMERHASSLAISSVTWHEANFGVQRRSVGLVLAFSTWLLCGLTSRSSGRVGRQLPASPGCSCGAPLNSRSVRRRG